MIEARVQEGDDVVTGEPGWTLAVGKGEVIVSRRVYDAIRTAKFENTRRTESDGQPEPESDGR